ncbi:SpoIIIAH-like family protein [Limnochorda pilosa]|uniref:Stage III sporulation protein AH n=1 Tax=Limnochorda pilosa TaxID=1555112 RepID=A0A0K2SMU3_LIMPI|nr:SpoIIIAH-like family protein [Limnochorda pilosa]BAS28430.1 hypothetical protein LIP_2600 [Limnochorda pilosa]
MVRFLVVGRRTWRWTLAMAIVLGLGAWAAMGGLTRPPLTPDQVRSAWQDVRGWVAGLLPAPDQMAETVSLGPPEAVPQPAAADPAAGRTPSPAPAAPVEAGGQAAIPASSNLQGLPVGSGYDLYRMDRARVRSQRMELLRGVLDDGSASEGRRAEAQQALLLELRQLEQELAIENLMQAQGYDGAVAVRGEDGVEVVLSQVLDEEKAGRLGGLVANLAGVGVQQVTLVDGLTSVR